MKSHKVKGVEHYLYASVEEFQQECPDCSYVANWREGKVGEYVLTDDGQVVEILRDNYLKVHNKKTRYVTTIIGTFICKDSVMMHGDIKSNYFSFQPSKKPKLKRGLSSSEKSFVLLVANGLSPIEAVRRVWSLPRDKAHSKSLRLMAQERIISKVREEVKEALSELGISREYILQHMKDILESGEKEANKVAILKEFIAILELRDERKSTNTMMLYSGFTDDQIEAVGGEEVLRVREPDENN